MANEQMTFSLGIKTTADMTGINQLKQELKTLNADIAGNADYLATAGLTPTQLNQASSAINTLGRAIDSAFDVNLNGINFNAFQNSLKASGTSLTTIGKQMSALGPEGVGAFSKMTAQVFKMNDAVQYSNKFVDKLWSTFKSTVVYTGFNAALNTASKAISNALGYTKDLDKSLNNIRIVSGQSAEQMKEFAIEANNAAKALGSTTTDYTDAALIYYQQGLRGEDVTGRTDVTQKMANVTGDSAEKVSQDLTAIWNNFYDGSKSLEYYADVITKLGASTAASSAEISAGLEKFAAISDTVGLSYEYATAALATVVAETRQSADTVGTAFKTIFGRLEGLKLGETLDDGTSLNKYSQALESVGVNIKQSNGQLKEMDQILDELGAKWDTLNKDQQVALAQTVGGTRQYTQLVALMDNWDKVQKNINIAANAEGELQKQQDVYMESLGAHMKQLKAESEDLYSDLFNSEDLIAWVDALTKGVKVIDSLVSSLGGLNNIAPTLLFTGANAMSGKIADSINGSINNRRIQKENYNDEMAKTEFLSQNRDTLGSVFENQPGLMTSDQMKNQTSFMAQMYEYRSQLNEKERESYNNLCQVSAELMKETDELERQQAEYQKNSGNNKVLIKTADFGATEESLKALNAVIEQSDGELKKLIEASTKFGSTGAASFKECVAGVEAWENALTKGENKSSISLERVNSLVNTFKKEIEAAGIGTEEANKKQQAAFKKLIELITKDIEKVKELRNEESRLRGVADSVNKAQKGLVDSQIQKETIQSYIQFTSALGQVAMGIQTIQNMGKIWENEELSINEKVLQTFMNLGFTLPIITSAFANLNKILQTSSAIEGLYNITLGKSIATKEADLALEAVRSTSLKTNVKNIMAKIAAENIDTSSVNKNTTAEELNTILKGKLNGKTKEQIAAIKAKIIQQNLDKLSTDAEYIAELKLKLLRSAALLGIMAVAAGIGILIQKRKEEIETTKEQTRATIDEQNQKQEEIKNNQKLYDSYIGLYKKYKNGEVAKRELYDVTKELCNIYGLEGGYVASLTGDYDKLTEAINKKRKAENEDALESAKREKTEAGRALVNSLSTLEGSMLGTTSMYQSMTQIPTSGGIAQTSEREKKSLGIIKSLDNKNISTIVQNSSNGPEQFLALRLQDYKDHPEEIYQAYKDLEKAKNQMEEELGDEINNNKVYDFVEEQISILKEAASSYEESLDDIQQYKLLDEAYKYNLDQIDNFDDFNKAKEKIINNLSKDPEIGESAEKLVNDYISSLNNSFSKKSLALDEITNQIFERSENPKEEIKEFLENLPEEDFNLLISGQIDIDKISTIDNLKQAIELAKKYTEEQDLGIVASLQLKLTDTKLSKSEIKEKLSEESILMDEYEVEMTDFDEQSRLRQAEILDEILTDKVEHNNAMISNQEDYVNSQKDLYKEEKINLEEYKENLENRQNQLKRKQHSSTGLTDDEKEELDSLSTDIDNVENKILSLNDAIDDLDNWNGLLDFDNTILSDTAVQVDSIITRMSILKDLSDSIGEGYSIAAKDIEEFGAAFPEIIANAENYQILQDGSMKLTKEATEALNDYYKKELEGKTESMKLELQKMIQQKQAQIDYYDSQIQALENFLSADQTEKNLEQQLEKNLFNYTKNLSDITGANNEELNSIMQQNANATADNAAQNQQNIFDNWVKVGEAAEAASLAYDRQKMTITSGDTIGSTGGVNTVDYSSDDDESSNSLASDEELEAARSALEDFKKAKAEAEGELSGLGSELASLLSNEAATLDSLSNMGKKKKDKSSSSKKDKDKKDWDDEYDRYWDINVSLDKIGDAMDRLQKKQDKLHGNELIASLKAENKLLEMQGTQYEALRAEQNKELSEIDTKLQGYGFNFNENGEMTNYIAQTKQLIEDYNNAVSQFNAGTMNEETFNNISKEYEKAKNLVGDYDKLIDKRRQQEKDEQERLDKIKENNLKAWETTIQIDLDMEEAKRDWNDFFGKVNQNFKSVYKDFDTKFRTSVFDSMSFGNSFQTELDAAKHVQEEMRKMESGQGSNEFTSLSQAQEELRSRFNNMKDDAEAIFDAYQEGWEDFNDYIDEAIDKFDDLTDKFERINDDLDHQGKLIELLYGQNDFENLDKLYDAQKKNYLGEMASLRDQSAFFKQQYEEMAKLYGEDSTAAQKFKESWLNAIDELHSKEEEYLDTLAKRYSNSINKAFSDFEKKLTNGSNFDFVSEQWDLSKKAAEGVFDEQEKIYQLQTLGNKYQEAINKASSAKSQQKLADLMASQVDSLKDKTRLTQYDVELAEKRLAVAEAEAALEDARENKNALKVTRGDDGNWSYQYVADEGDVDDKEQALLDAQYDAYEFVKQNVSDTKEALMELAKDWEDHIRDLEEKMIGATEEEKAQYQEMIDWYNNYYGKEIGIKAEELKKHEVHLAQETNGMLQTEYNVNTANYELMTNNQKALIDGLREYSIQGATDIYNGINGSMDFIAEKGDEVMRETIEYFDTAASEITDRWANEPDSVAIVMQETLDQCGIALDEYITSVKEGCIAAGEDFTNVGAAIEADRAATEALKDETNKLVDETSGRLEQYKEYISALEKAWIAVQAELQNAIALMETDLTNALKNMIDDTVELINKTEDAISLQAQLASAANDINSTAKNKWKDVKKDEYQYEYASGGVYNVYKDGKKISMTGVEKGFNIEQQLKNMYGDIDVKQYDPSQSSFKVSTSNDNNHGIKEASNGAIVKSGFVSKSYAEMYLKKNFPAEYANGKYIAFNTGGYTGTWSNDSGKLAMLHQKELVLNADDTDNMLKAVSAVRDLSSIQSNIQQAVADSIAKALINIAGLGGASSTYNSSTVDSSQNNVFNINADFPNANSVLEIQEAILGLPNAASQAIGRQSK